jgi:hypothetical protein
MEEELRMFQVKHVPLSGKMMEPTIISISLVIMKDHSWFAFVNGLLLPSTSPSLSKIPSILTVETLIDLVHILQSSPRCCGNSDARFVSLCERNKGKFYSLRKTLLAYIQTFDGSSTVRHVSCEVLVNKEGRCAVCSKYRNQLRALYSSSLRSNCNLPQTNFRYFNTPQRKSRFISLRKKCNAAREKNRRLTAKLTSLSGVATVSMLTYSINYDARTSGKPVIFQDFSAISLIVFHNDDSNENYDLFINTKEEGLATRDQLVTHIMMHFEDSRICKLLYREGFAL